MELVTVSFTPFGFGSTPVAVASTNNPALGIPGAPCDDTGMYVSLASSYPNTGPKDLYLKGILL